MKEFFGRENYYLRLLSDFMLVVIAYYITAIVSYKGSFLHDREILLVLIITWYFSSKWIHIYDDFRTLKYIDEFFLLLPMICIQGVVLILGFFLVDNHENARKFVFEYLLLLMLPLGIKKYISKKVYQHFRRNGTNQRNLLIVGSSNMGMSFYDFVSENSQFGYKPVGFVDDSKPLYLNELYKGTLKDIHQVIVDYKVDEVIVAMSNFDRKSLQEIIMVGEKNAIRTRIIPDYFSFNSNKFRMEMFGNFPVITVRDEPLNKFHWRVIKRFVDIVFSLLVCVLLFSWLFPIIMLLIRLDSKGNVFFIQDRWGRNNQLIRCFKFRTMRADSKVVVAGKFQQTTAGDARITKIGAFLRKTNLDELPQFINVLLGNMSVVGPRPHAVPHNIESQALIDNYSLRHWVKPGITGWAQVNGLRGETKDFSLMRKRVEFDIWYIENWTPWLDFKIVGMTIYNIFKGDEMAY